MCGRLFNRYTLVFLLTSLFICPLLTIYGATTQNHVKPPVAKVIPKKLEKHGNVRIDNYYWLKERDNPEVVAYLEAENDYAEKVMTHTKDLQAKLVEEFSSLYEKREQPVPYKKGDYLYYERYEKDRQYPLYCRKKGSMKADEEVLIDVDQLAKDHDNFALAPLEVSPEQNILAYGVDTTGNRNIWTFYFKDLKTGELLPEVIRQTHHLTAWANDNRTFFYVRKNQVYRHLLGTDPSEDKFLLENIGYLYKSKSAKYILMFSALGPWEWKGYLDADDPMGNFKEVVPPKQGYKCFRLEHSGDKFYFLSNGLMEIPVGSTKLEDASVVISPRDDVNIDHLEVFKDHLVLKKTKNGLSQLHIISLEDGKEHFVDFGEPVYSVSAFRLGGFELGSFSNAEFNSHILRYNYSSLTTPKSNYDYNMATREQVLVGQEQVGSGFDPSNYQSERLWAIAEDGVKIPISLVYRKGIKKDGGNPLLLDGYGMWGSSQEAGFIGIQLSLLDRGFICATAHVRGGSELGDRWYAEGRLLKKKNSFTDFVSCARYLIDKGYTHPERLFASGISGGGLLMAGVITMAPELFKGVIIKVPDVDIITRILEEDLSYNPGNYYDELGNPNKKEHYEYILSYAPYDNIEAREYPNILITAGFHDTRVHYWQPSKLAAKLRANKTDQNILLLKTNMTGGHGGAMFSGRLESYKEIACEYAFLLNLAGIRE